VPVDQAQEAEDKRLKVERITDIKSAFAVGPVLAEGSRCVVRLAGRREGAGAYQTVILKIIPLEYIEGFDRVDKVEVKREASLLEKIEHPNIVRVKGLYESSAHCYHIQERVAGGTL